MGISFTGTFTKFSLKSPPVTSTPPVDPGAGTPGGFFYASMNNTNVPQVGTSSYTPAVTGTPTFVTPRNTSSKAAALKVLSLKRGTDKVTYSGDFSALVGDFTMQFWINIDPNNGATGENVFFFGGGSSGVRFYMRATQSVGNSQGFFDITYRDAAGEFRTVSLPLAVSQWNNLIIAKKGSVLGYVANGSGSGTFHRWNNSTAVCSTGQTSANVAAPPATVFNGTTFALGGIGMQLADMQIKTGSDLPFTFMQNYVSTPYHSQEFYF